MEFVYATSTTATATELGDYAGRVKEVRLWSRAGDWKRSVSHRASPRPY